MVFMNENFQTDCHCKEIRHKTKWVVLTGGPGAGKTAILQIAQRTFCRHVMVLPESASILLAGGFLKSQSVSGRCAFQRAVYHVQKQLEYFAANEKDCALILCDRGSLDSLGYWPNSEKEFFEQMHTSIDKELKVYDKVIHVQTPSLEHGYNHQNPVRVESADEAAALDRRIQSIWNRHRNFQTVNSSSDFLEKSKKVMELIRSEIPECCWRETI